jgi:hypothetical protein
VTELARPFLDDMSLPAVTKHLKVLERAGLITKTREAQWRPCRLNGDAFKDVADWMEQYRAFWEESFDRLDEYLKTVTARSKPAVDKTTAAATSDASTTGSTRKVPAKKVAKKKSAAPGSTTRIRKGKKHGRRK